jgi:hypothetical protein
MTQCCCLVVFEGGQRIRIVYIFLCFKHGRISIEHHLRREQLSPWCSAVRWEFAWREYLAFKSHTHAKLYSHLLIYLSLNLFSPLPHSEFLRLLYILRIMKLNLCSPSQHIISEYLQKNQEAVNESKVESLYHYHSDSYKASTSLQYGGFIREARDCTLQKRLLLLLVSNPTSTS